MNEDKVAIRLKGFIDEMGLTNSQFADQCGIPRPSLSQLLSGRNKKISDVLVGQIHSAFPKLSVLWLLFGEGDMMVQNKEESQLSGSNEISSISDGSLFGESETAMISDTGKGEYSNLTHVEMPQNRSSRAVNKESIEAQRVVELSREIEKMKKNPRKVVQITVYYDDSTFETFYPAGK